MVNYSDDYFKDKLSPEQYRVLRQKATEPPFSGRYVDNDDPGIYKCAACGQVLFTSDTKYESTTPGLIGWPSFSEVVSSGAIELKDDTGGGMQRLEVVCSNCGSHLGHVFDEDISPSGKHYCINSCALDFEPEN